MMLAQTVLFLLFARFSFCYEQLSSNDLHHPSNDQYHENLIIKPLGLAHDTINPTVNTDVLAHFEFLTTTTVYQKNNGNHQHYRFFPRQIGEMVQQHHVREFELAFSQGNWQMEKWGYPPTNDAATGAKISGVVDGVSEDGIRSWKGLINTLSGIFCASLNQADEKNSVKSTPNSVEEKIQFLGPKNRHALLNTTKFAGYLPRENVCTENLTPFIKQLPCQNKAGIAKLLNPYKLFDSGYYSMSISFTESCLSDQDCSTKKWNFKQSISVVLDSKSTKEMNTLSLFDRDLKDSCSVADSSKIFVLLETSPENFKIQPTSGTLMATEKSLSVYEHDLNKNPVEKISISLDIQKGKGQIKHSSVNPLIIIHRYITGKPGVTGNIQIVVNNNFESKQEVVIFDSMPWFLKVYFHTMKIQQISKDGKISIKKPKSLLISPSIARQKPSAMELTLDLEPLSSTFITFSFEKVFIKIAEHPPDANRGFNVEPSVLSFTTKSLVKTGQKYKNYETLPLSCLLQHILYPSQKVHTCKVRLYSELFVATLPTPDFSMPYNVITFTSTVIALYFGRMFTLLTKDLVYDLE